MLIKGLTGLASPAGGRARLTTFIFHRVLDKPDPVMPSEPDTERFKTVLSWMCDQYEVLDPLDACARLQAGALPSRAAMISFDDGYADNCMNALPILKQAGVTACFFIATGFTRGGAMFNDRVCAAVAGATLPSLALNWLDGGPLELINVAQKRAAIGRLLPAIKRLPLAERHDRVLELIELTGADAHAGLMMSEEQLRSMAGAGMTLGGHTRNHPILKSLNPEAAEAEIRQGRQDLIDMTGSTPTLFAYPNGAPGRDFDQSHMAMVERAGFRFAFSTQKGAATARSNPLALPRFTPWDRSRGRFSLRMLQNTFAGDPGLAFS